LSCTHPTHPYTYIQVHVHPRISLSLIRSSRTYSGTRACVFIIVCVFEMEKHAENAIRPVSEYETRGHELTGLANLAN
jgi:hypothetical protein